MAVHTALPQMFYNAVWNGLTPALDPTSYVLTDEKIRITRGITWDGGDPRPAKIECRIYDAADKYRPTNPSSPIYGAAGQNTTFAVTCDGSTRGFAQCSSFRPDQSSGFQVGPPLRGLRWIDLEAEGLLRQLGLWSQPLRSPIYRDITSLTNLLGYWPLEDSVRATQLSNAKAGGQPGQAAGAQFENVTGAAGSDKVVGISVAAGTTLSGRFVSASSTAGWQVCFSCQLPATVASGASIFTMFTWTTTNGYTWQLNINSTTYSIAVIARDGTTLLNVAYTYGTSAGPGQWIRFRVKGSVSAGTVTASTAWYPQDNAFSYSGTNTFAGSVGALASWRVAANIDNDGGGYGHVLGVTGTADDFLGGYHYLSFNGYVGERAEDRFKRLCDEEGVTRTYVGAVATTWTMGRQTPSTFIELLKEVARTEDGMIYDSRTQIGLVFRSRRDRYNQTVKMALTYPADIAPPLIEVISDIDAHNYVTVSQRDGGEATAIKDTGVMSIAAPPSGIGEYKQNVDVNVELEADLPVLAGWWLSKGTIPGARYEQVVIDLDENPGLTTTANSVDLGDRITVTGRTPDLLDLLVIGIYEEIEAYRRKITFTCVPGDVWKPAVYGGATGRRYGITASTTNGALTTTGTSLTANITTDEYSTTSVPYDLNVTGERMTVTAAAAAGATTQALTVTRSVNGVVKTHVAGEPIQIHDDHVARYGL